MIPAGQRDRRIRFERAVSEETPEGVDGVAGWVMIENAMAKVLYGTGAERRGRAAEGSTQAATFRVLATTKLRGVSEVDCRIVDRDNRDEAWEIKSVSPIGRTEIEFGAIRARG